MKKLILILIVAAFVGCDSSDDEEDVLDELLQQEIEDLQFLKEEEKLARDVYLFSYDLYAQQIFKNISNSEQSHMNSVSVILEKYNIQDLSLDERGKFSNDILQKLYNDLTDLGSKSLEDALIAGATIEDLDINDLNRFIINTNHEDIEEMYELLTCGSRNHLRGFTNNLDNLGASYDPQFLSIEEYNETLNGSHEQCNN
jgi:hypothetical protein